MSNCCSNEKTSQQLNRQLSVKQMLEIQHELNNHLKGIGKGWVSTLSVAQFETALVAELCGELLNQDSAPQYKWWKNIRPEQYSEWMTKLEVVDAVHFYLSIAILRILGELSEEECRDSDPFQQFDPMYVGSDEGKVFFGVGIIDGCQLKHERYMAVVKEVLSDDWDFFGWVDTLDMMVSSMGMTSEEVSALYTAKAALNEFRWSLGDSYTKVDGMGVEDNERLFPLVQAFLDDTSMTLAQLKVNIQNEFYQPVV